MSPMTLYDQWKYMRWDSLQKTKKTVANSPFAVTTDI